MRLSSFIAAVLCVAATPVCAAPAGRLAANPVSSAKFGAAAVAAPPGANPETSTQPAGAAPNAAKLVVYERVVTLNWDGSSDARMRSPLCIASPTGRVRLTVLSTGGGQLQGKSPFPYVIRFVDADGVVQQQSTASGPRLTFDGSSGSARTCLAQSNAQLDVILPSEALLGSSAGTYSDGLKLQVDVL